jgi:20S proteasome alpha/beta subunit
MWHEPLHLKENPVSYELEEQFIARLTAPLRHLSEHPPQTLGMHLGQLFRGTTDPGPFLHGTTIGAFTIEHGQRALAFSDGKVSMGNVPVHLAYRKILEIDHYTRMLIAGSPVVGMHHAAAIKAWIGFREDTTGEQVSARAKVKFLSRLLLGSINLMHTGIVCAPILVTYDIRRKKAARIFSLGVDGSEIEHTDCTAGGSGASVNVLLKNAWRADLTFNDGVALAQKLILETAPQNDSFSGGKVSIDLVGPDGARTIQ